MPRGKFITLEGGEGAGKSTQAARLAKALRTAGLVVLTTREPGGAPEAEKIRELLLQGSGWDPITEALLHFAARREHLVHTVLPALKRGEWVVSDRFADSTMAYQGYGLGVDRALIEDLYRLAVGDIRPDLTFILDIPVDEGFARLAGRGIDADRYERMDRDFHERLRQGFLDIAGREPDRCIVIDGRGDAAAIGAAMLAAVRDRLGGVSS